MIKFIADIGSNHNGDLHRLHMMIDLLTEMGAWGIKLQVFKAEKLMVKKLLTPEIKMRELPLGWIPGISEHCKDNKIKFGCTPFYDEAVEIVAPYVDFLKIASFDILRKSLIRLCLATKKQFMISLGLAEDENIHELIADLIEYKYKRESLVLMHCVSNYPTPLEKAAISRVKDLTEKYIHISKIGYSDHTTSLYAILSAIINGAEYIEMHYDMDDNLGWESGAGHCWSNKNFSNMIKVTEQIEKSNSKFNIGLMDTARRTNPVTGLREY